MTPGVSKVVVYFRHGKRVVLDRPGMIWTVKTAEARGLKAYSIVGVEVPKIRKRRRRKRVSKK